MVLKFYFKISTGIIVAAFMTCCGGRSVSVTGGRVADSTVTFRLPDIPNAINGPAERSIYLSEHYWDYFDFQDTSLIHKPDISEQAFANYILLLDNLPAATVKESMEILIKRASQNWDIQNFIIDLFGKYLYEPNSPYRNEDLYIPFLEILVKLPSARTEDVMTGEFRLKMALKNRPGSVAADFSYGDGSGRTGRLSEVESEYVLLFFYDPDCENCREASRMLADSPVSSCRRLKIMAIYPDDDVEAWKEKMNDFPGHWINGYSPEGEVVRKNLYDVKAMPSFYVLNRDKKVVLKDVALEYALAYLDSAL